MFTVDEIRQIRPSVLRIYEGSGSIYDTFNRVFTLVGDKVNGDIWDTLAKSIELWLDMGINKTEVNETFVNRVRGYLSGEMSGPPEKYAAATKSAASAGTEAEASAADAQGEAAKPEVKNHLRDGYVPGVLIRDAYRNGINENRRKAGNTKVRTIIIIVSLLLAFIAVYYFTQGINLLLQ